MKRVLILASVASMIDQFNIPNIRLLQTMGYQVDVACNFKEGNTCSDERIEELKNLLKEMDVEFYDIGFARNITSIGRNLKAYTQVKELLKNNQYEFLHCHSPIGGVVGRLAGKQQHVKVIYTAHGFHFFKGAPLKNWLIYYPIEKWLSKYTDVLITINTEDFAFAKKKMKAKKIEYVPGVGINLTKFVQIPIDKGKKREELGINKDEKILLSVGELNQNKNHEVVIRAISDLDVCYLIAGKGEREAYLKELAKKLGVAKKVRFLGYRDDIQQLLGMSDIFVFPSYREGLSVSLMEAMACGKPVVCSRIRGNVDLIDENGGELFDPRSISDCRKALLKMINGTSIKRMGMYNKNRINSFGKETVKEIMDKLYEVS